MRTGPQRPVRTFRIFGGGVAALALATAVLRCRPPPPSARTVPVAAAAQGISDFYAARSNRPLWFSQPGRQVDAACSKCSAAPNSMDWTRTVTASMRFGSAPSGAAQSGNRKAVRRADTMLSQAFVDYVRDLRRPATPASSTSIRELKPTPPSASRNPRTRRERAVAGALRRRDALDESDLRPAPQGACNAGATVAASSATWCAINLERVRELPAGDGPLHRRQRGGAAPLHVREWRGRGFHARGGRQARLSDADDERLRPLRGAQSLLVRPARPRRRADRAQRRQAGRELSRPARLSGRVATSSTIPKIIDPATIDWQAVADGRQQGPDPPAARARTIRWAG